MPDELLILNTKFDPYVGDIVFERGNNHVMGGFITAVNENDVEVEYQNGAVKNHPVSKIIMMFDAERGEHPAVIHSS